MLVEKDEQDRGVDVIVEQVMTAADATPNQKWATA